MASLNHPMNAVISVWFYKHLCGLKLDPQQAGFDRFLIEPVFPKKLSSAQCSFDTIKGQIKVDWQREAGKITVKLTVPYNSTAVARFREPASVHASSAPDQALIGEQTTLPADGTTRWVYTLPAGCHILQLG